MPLRTLLLLLAAAAAFSCSRNAAPAQDQVAAGKIAAGKIAAGKIAAGKIAAESAVLSRVQATAAVADLPEAVAAALTAAVVADPARFSADLGVILAQDAYLRALVDKTHALPADYEPADLTPLTAAGYRLNRQGLVLRSAAAQALAAMGTAAEKDGVTLLVSSAYRSYEYQRGVYNRIVAEVGEEAADRESAKPGHSQHQLGLAVDFGSIDDSFARTAASRWLAAHAGRFAWSLSYPESYEEVTGYRWESWHYRYVGPELVVFIDRYFGGIQQYALAFLSFWTWSSF